MPVINRATFSVFLFVVVAMSGCGGSGPSGKLAGPVTFEGQPAVGAEVAVVPAEGGGQAYYGLVSADGILVLDYRTAGGMKPGKYNVEITYHTTLEGKPLPAGEEGYVLKTDGKTKEKRFRFPVEIAATTVNQEFALTSDKEVAPEE